jgi:flavodoxin short chain
MNKIAVIFWTGTGNTEVMANEVVAGAKEAGADVTLFNTSAFSADKAQEFDKFALGCPAMGAEELEDSEFQPLYDQLKAQISGKKVVLFGSYGWGGGSVKQISAKLEEAGFTLVNDGLQKLWVPDETALADCVAYGRQFAQAL